MLWTVIMAGGKGERFWPKSREKTPKQLLPITSEKTMIQLTVERLSKISPPERILIITSKVQKEEMIRQLPMLAPENIISEPVGRDTAPCIATAAQLLLLKDPDAVMLVLPADHVISNHEKFTEAMLNAADQVTGNNNLMTFGITPDHPATGYGYLKISSAVESSLPTKFHKVESFVEKPDYETAKQYLDSGKFLWNSGIFLWQASTIINEIKNNMPELYHGIEKIKSNLLDMRDLDETLDNVYPNLPKISIDFGVMENAQNVLAGIATFDWDDVGSWEAVAKHFKKDDNGNIIIGQAVLQDCKNNIVYNMSDKKMISGLIGMSNNIIVQTEDSLLIVPREKCQQVKDLVNRLKELGLKEYL